MKLYESSTPKSKELFEEARKYIPGGVTYSIRYFEPYPLYVAKADGQAIWDVDGNRYVDFWLGHGALFMGHRYPPVVEAAHRQLEEGAHVGLPHIWEIRLAKQICSMVPSVEKVRFTNSGTEANMYVVRLARAYTKKKTIVRFEGNWHGGYDALHLAVSPPYERLPAGLTEEAVKNTVVLPYNDLDAAEKGLKKLELAAVIVEPVAGAGGFIPADEDFLKRLRELCDELDALLIFDEVITGFRLAPGGAQQLYGVKPDLTTFGKIVGGGEFAAGAFGGRADVMELLDQIAYPSPHERSFQGGTFSANPLMTRAGYTLLSELAEKQEIYAHVNTLGLKARKSLQEIFDKYGVRAHVTGIGSLFAVHFTAQYPRDVKTAQTTKNLQRAQRYFCHLIENRIFCLTPQTQHFFLSAAHLKEDIDQLIQATEEFAYNERRRGESF